MTGSMTGRTLGNRYTIEDRVGLGGMAEVYRATDNVLGRPVAVKVMLPQYAEDETFTKRFRQEAASAANLQSPYIVNIYDWGQDGGQYYIVMEFVRGADLKTGVSQRGAINQRKVAEIGSQVCQALSVAHNQDIIHRDIKPQNIMVQPDGNIKVMDFGIARAKNAGLTQTSSVLGTAHYISPEQAQGKTLGPSSDIYSLGVVMYEAATGQLPFDGPDAVSVAMKQVSEEPVPPRAINNEIDPALEAIILKAMAKDPANRFTTALDMRHALNDYLAGRPVAVGNTFSNASTQLMGGVAAPVAVGTATQVMPSMPATGTRQPESNVVYKTPTDNPPKKNSTGRTVGIVVAIIAAIAIVAAAALFIFGQGGNISVPDVTNRSLEEATTLLTDQKLKVGSVTYANSDTVAEGKVISQDPTSGTRKDEGSAVNLVVSSGVEQIVVPDLKNMTAAEAQAALSKLGLKSVAGNADYSADVEQGRIMSQSPAANEKVSKGTTVQYCLSLGVETVTVPNVVNYEQSQAISTLEAAGFKVEVQTGESEQVASGNVYKQDPSSGKLETGKTVTIYVSTGSSRIDIPYVIGDTLSVARGKMSTAGFIVSVSGPDDGNAVVINQSDTGKGTQGQNIWLTTQGGNTTNGNTNTASVNSESGGGN
ncbi:MAG: Stk1 family PASTA domain-containing Ser/Thr kinase [Coriobacteriia bacterium]|nr:Stk1 family PASTA domain-containing Ser/Thr kinase [Coriobacteriia bacterium]